MTDHLEQANRKFRGSMELAKAKMQGSLVPLLGCAFSEGVVLPW